MSGTGVDWRLKSPELSGTEDCSPGGWGGTGVDWDFSLWYTSETGYCNPIDSYGTAIPNPGLCGSWDTDGPAWCTLLSDADGL